MNGDLLIGIDVHPLAEIFPMMSDGELAELAADIKANGLINPIMLDHAGEVLIDGRNRLAACRRARVEPRFERLAADADPLAIIVSLNVKRRNLSASQRAVAAAEAWSQAAAEGRVQEGAGRPQLAQSGRIISSPRDHFAALFGVGKNYVEMARALWLDDPPAADAVKAGTADLREKHQELMQRLGRQKTRDTRVRELAEARPDLAEKVQSGDLTIEAATFQARQEAEEQKQQRWAITVNLIDLVTAADREPESAADVVELFDPAVEASKGGPKLTRERLERAAAYLSALAVLWEETK